MEIKLLLVLCYFNPRTPRGVRLAADAPTPPHPCISIHAPREGCDTAIAASYTPLDLFQSTHPARGATCAEHCDRHPCGISIHAPREGCDGSVFNDGLHQYPFQSTHPARGATCRPLVSICPSVFQSTHPARGATALLEGHNTETVISIHAPREGCDDGGVTKNLPVLNFNPRTPRGVRRQRCGGRLAYPGFQSTHPARGATANFTKEQRVCLAQFAYLHKGKKAEHTKTNAPMLH